MFAIIYLLGPLIADLLKSRRRLEVENLFLRHQLNIILRRPPQRLRLQGSDRAVMVWMTRLWPSLLALALLCSPPPSCGGTGRVQDLLAVCTESSIRVDHVSESPNLSGDDRSVLRLPRLPRRSSRRADLRQRTRLCAPTRLGHKNIRYTELAPDRLKNFWR
jgi:hypothetical protein